VGRVRRFADAAAALSRRALLADLEAYVPANEREASMLSQLRAFVAEHDDCFERTLAIGHVTGSAWVVDRAGEAALLTHHRKLGKWLQLGGHADGDPDIRGVALREALEESGLARVTLARDAIYDVDVHEIPARGAEAAHFHYDVRFAFYADRGDVPIASEESHAVAWVPLAEIERFTIDDSVRRLVAKTPALISASAR
jgi:8-oxo-dGTP pyrophosphatase MutT (NUDIX family)